MKSALLCASLVITSSALHAEDAAQPAPAATETPERTSASDAATSQQELLALCPTDMPPACACVVQGEGVRVMPANEAYMSRKRVLLVGPKN